MDYDIVIAAVIAPAVITKTKEGTWSFGSLRIIHPASRL